MAWKKTIYLTADKCRSNTVSVELNLKKLNAMDKKSDHVNHG